MPTLVAGKVPGLPPQGQPLRRKHTILLHKASRRKLGISAQLLSLNGQPSVAPERWPVA